MRKKRYETITINGIEFIYDTKGGKKPEFTRWDYSTIYTAYNKPSETKIAIWESWKRWLHEIVVKTGWQDQDNVMWVDSRNGFIFTISGYIVNPDTYELLGIHITPTKNECWSITE